MKYKRFSKKSGHNRANGPKGDSEPSGIIDLAKHRTPTELKAFKDLGVAPEHLEESYLAAFLACWLCKFVFPKDNVDFVRPGVFKVASRMAAGESFGLAIPVLANIYHGLSVVTNSVNFEDRAAVLPYHYVYGWLGEYFGTHFPSSALSKLEPSSSTPSKLGPLMTKYSGVLSAKNLDDLQARALFRSYEGLKMNRLARMGPARQDITDDLDLRSSNLSYLISLRSGYVSLRQEDRRIVQSYSPHRFSRQFGFVQSIPGRLKERKQSESLHAVYMHWESCTRAYTNASITLPAKDEFKGSPVTCGYVNWWSQVHYEILGMANGTSSSRSRKDVPREGRLVIPAQPVPLDCSSAVFLQDRPLVSIPQHPCLFPQHPDAHGDTGDEVDSCEDGLVSKQRQQIINKRPLEDAHADSDVNFRHKKKEVFRPSPFDGRVSLEKDVGPSCSFGLATTDILSFTDMLFGDTFPMAEEIERPPDAELVSNLPSCPSLPRVSEGMQGPVTRPPLLPASSDVSLRGPNLHGTEQLIHRIRLNAAMDVKSHIEERISKCPWEDLALLKEDLSKLVSAIDALDVDSLPLRAQIAELMAASTEYSSLRAISSKKLSPDVKTRQLAEMDLSIAQVRSSEQAVLKDYQATGTSLASVQARLEALEQEREQLGIEASRLEGILSKQEGTISQYQNEVSCLEQEKGMTMELPTLSLTDVDALKTLEGLLEARFRGFRDIVL